MLYLIDGYNLLFSLDLDERSLKESRCSLIDELNRKAKRLNLDLVLIFDGLHHASDMARSHYDALEVVYTSAGESADDYIIDEIERREKGPSVVVVSSDNKLCRRAKVFGAASIGCSQFLSKLDRSLRKKKREVPKLQKVVQKTFQRAPTLISPIVKKPPPNASAIQCLDYYLAIFQKRYNTIS
ncbi:NYN domain-containing protein, partial [Simkania negevensis]|nr:NYN domain-containing protein [Simkania negevensis]